MGAKDQIRKIEVELTYLQNVLSGIKSAAEQRRADVHDKHLSYVHPNIHALVVELSDQCRKMDAQLHRLKVIGK